MVFIPTNTKIGNSVFIGPNSVLTNDRYPPYGNPRLIGPVLEDNATIGANVTILPGVRIGKSAAVALLGWAFIANTDDARNTPSEVFHNLAREAGAEVIVHDPWVESYPGVVIQEDLDTVLSGSDSVVIFTGHNAYRKLSPEYFARLCKAPRPVIVDGRNIIDPDLFIRAGFVYRGIGRRDKNDHLME